MNKQRHISLLAFLWPLAALGAFAGLQWWRLHVFEAIHIAVQTGSTTTASPRTISSYGSWMSSASNLQARSHADAFHVLSAVNRVPSERPDIVMMVTGAVVALGAIGAVTLTLGVALLMRAPWILPFTPSRKLRFAAAKRTVTLSWPWTVLIGAIAGAVVWHTGFDRGGRSTLLVDGMVPTVTQCAAILGAWILVALPVCLALAQRALNDRAPTGMCARCAYVLDGLRSDRCPECGLSIHAVANAARAAYASHLAAGLRLAVILLALVTPTIVIISRSPRLIRWAELKPSLEDSSLAVVSTLSPASAASNLHTAFGELSLTVKDFRPQPPLANVWRIAWSFEPSNTSGLAPASGEFTVSDEYGRGSHRELHTERLPPGDLMFFSHLSRPDELCVSGLPLVFSP